MKKGSRDGGAGWGGGGRKQDRSWQRQGKKSQRFSPVVQNVRDSLPVPSPWGYWPGYSRHQGSSERKREKREQEKAKGLVLFRMFVIAYLSLLLEGIGQVTVGIREVGLQLYGSSVCVDGQVYQPEQTSKIIRTGQITMTSYWRHRVDRTKQTTCWWLLFLFFVLLATNIIQQNISPNAAFMDKSYKQGTCEKNICNMDRTYQQGYS